MKASLRPFYLSDEMTKLPSLRVADPRDMRTREAQFKVGESWQAR